MPNRQARIPNLRLMPVIDFFFVISRTYNIKYKTKKDVPSGTPFLSF
jgi:hypothetical protein